MKIGILTFHFAVNHGAVLQCLALEKELTKLCNIEDEVYIIDYEPKYHTTIYSTITNPFISARALATSLDPRNPIYVVYRYFRNIIAVGKSNLHPLRKRKRREIFCNYTQKHYKLTEIYTNSCDLANKNDFDIILLGSDQIWNKKVTNHFYDEVYFGKGIEKARLYSYAASGGFDDDSEEFKYLFKKLRIVSLREKSDYQYVSNAVNISNLRLDVDPTLLLDRNDYLEFEDKCVLPESYIFFYMLPSKNNDKLATLLYKIAHKLNMPVVDASPNRAKLHIPVTHMDYISPGEFLTCIKNAKYIITNSFHGTVFSIIYNRSFLCMAPTLHSDRITDLLDILGLNNQMIDNLDDYYKLMNHICWEEVNAKGAALREKSIEYLQDILAGKI